MIKSGIKDKAITVEDWAMVHKAPGGELTITKDKATDPGAARGGLVGGGAGAVLAVLSGPIGVGAVAVGAAIGAVTAAVKDSGFKDHDIKEISKQMADGRTGIMVGVPLEAVDQWDAFVADHSEFAAADTPAHGRHRARPDARGRGRGVPPPRGRRPRPDAAGERQVSAG